MANRQPQSLMSYLAQHPSEGTRGVEVEAALGDPHGYKPGDPLTISMSKDVVEMTQKMSEVIDASGKVELLFIEERAERRQAVNDIWDKIKELQNEVRASRTKERVMNLSAEANGAPQMRAAANPSADRDQIMQDGLELARIESEMATHRAQMQELRFMCENLDGANQKGHGRGPEATPELTRKMDALTVDVANLRDLWVNVQMGLSMSTVRASRIALRTADLSATGRKQALSILEGKEEAIAKQFEEIRQDRSTAWSTKLMLPDPLEGVTEALEPAPAPQGHVQGAGVGL